MLRPLLLVLLAAAAASASAQSTYYVATDGDNANAGTIEAPFATVSAALTRSAPGDTVYVRGGTYSWRGTLTISQSGTEGAYLHVWAYPGEEPVFDFQGNSSRGVDLQGDYVHLKGVTVQNAADNGVYVAGASNNVIENVVARYNGDSGVQVADGAAHNLVLNVDSYGNYDASNHGENADGFAVKFGVGPGNVLRGCRAWGNSDDGYDFWEAGEGVTVEGSWAFDNGYNVWGDTAYQGDSNGFKLGHGAGPHVLTRNLAWGHRAHGFDVNGNTSGVTLYHNTAYDNDGRDFNFDDDSNVTELGPYVLRNNVSVAGDVRMDRSVVDAASNSWNGGVSATAADFASLDDTGADRPRGPGGNLPELDFLRLTAGSDLVDAGVDVGLPFAGAAPDLGAYEVGLVTSADPAPPGAPMLALVGPNPFRQRTRLAVDLAVAERVHLAVYDGLGRHVSTLLDGPAPAGRHTVEWEAGALAPGLYVVRLQAGPVHAALPVTRLR